MNHSLKEWERILKEKKEKLDNFRPLPPELINNLNEWFTIELTYNSNAIEGNTLSKSETAMVVEKGLTIGGKTVREHLEAINHAFALGFIREIAQKSHKDITLSDILDIHRLVLRGIDNKNAGALRTIQVSIAGSDITLPNPVKVPDLMNEFIEWLHSVDEFPVTIAADAHFKLVAIHPFVDGNGRTARLVMNLLLLQAGYPPAVVPIEERKVYIDAIAEAEKTGDLTDFYTLIYQAVNVSLDKYLSAAQASAL